MASEAEDSRDKKYQDNKDSNSKKVVEHETEEDTILLKSVEETLERLKSASSSLMEEDDTDLDDDETEKKLKTLPPKVKSSVPRRKTSEVVPKMISDDIATAYQAFKTNQEKGGNDQRQEREKPENIPTRYDLGQASLMGAVLGIGERDKSKDDVENRELPSMNSKIGTLAGLGAVADEDLDLNESDDASWDKSETLGTEGFVEENVINPQTNDCTNQLKDSKYQEENKPSASRDQQVAEDSAKVVKTNVNESGGLMRIIRRMKEKLLHED
ncbi:uncharacterized protein [Parasteatoda tepidariorum]|uniref:uncharacterized protein n=1 Tax=Parasteatoda tepidariorum TaxID=114398 RepID=UPI0039BC53BA